MASDIGIINEGVQSGLHAYIRKTALTFVIGEICENGIETQWEHF